MIQRALPASADAARVYDVHERVLKFTRDCFGEHVELEPLSDPETGEVTHAAKVKLTGSVEQILAESDRWHRELVAIAGDLAHNYCLSLEVE